MDPHSALAVAAIREKAKPDARGTHHLKHSISTDAVVSVSSARLYDYAQRASGSSTVRTLFFLWGLAIASLHLSAIAISAKYPAIDNLECKQMLRPWLTRQPGCSVFEYNCYMARSHTATDKDLSVINSATLAVVIFAHCPALTMPRAILRFPNLLGVEVHSTTVVRWDQSAPISSNHHQKLAYLQIIRTNLTHLPDALVTSLPPSLQDTEFAECNLTSLPEHLDSLWHPLAVFVMEKCGIMTVPYVLMRVPVDELSLYGNRIESLSPPWTSQVSIPTKSLVVGQNPFKN